MIQVNGYDLTTAMLCDAAKGDKAVLTKQAKENINKSREYVNKLVAEERVVYGITTGFGKFSDVRVSPSEAKQLQKNLIVSHACGTGPAFSPEITRVIMLLRANALAKGFSGIRLSTVELLLEMYNRNVLPVIPEKGSLGASGDLAPLAHMVLPMIGLGEAMYGGVRMPGAKAMEKAGLSPIELTEKEGLALINGTQVLTAVGALTAQKAVSLMKLCDIAAALTGEALNCVTDAFRPEIHQIRPHPCQISTAENLNRLLEGSARTTRQGELRLQDAYSMRCVPQIHAASKDTLRYVLEKLEIEINSATDNPGIFPDLDMALSGGNFHGQPLALPLDFLGIALAEMANVSERRIERLVNPHLSDLPPFLTKYGGICSGFMIAQYVAAALVSENKILAHPASVDSIPSSGNQEDHVSMGTIAARKARDIGENLSHVIAIELVASCQAIDLSHYADKPLGRGTRAAYDVIRKHISRMDEDRVLYRDFDAAAALVDNGDVLKAVEKAVGELSL